MIPIDNGGSNPVRPPPPPPPKPPPAPAKTQSVTRPNNDVSTFKPAQQPKYPPVTPVDPAAGGEIPGSVRAGVQDGNQVVDALNKGGPAAAAQKLKQLIAADAQRHNPDHATYASALAGATANDIAQSIANDPANAAQNWQAYLNAIPASDASARSNLVVTGINAATTPEARQAIAEGSGAVMQQLASSPDNLQSQLDIVTDPAARSALAAQAAPAIQKQVEEQAKTDPVAAAKLLDQYVSAAPDEASRTAILKACAPAISDMEAKINGDAQANLGQLDRNDYGADDVVKSLTHAASLAGTDGTKVITDALAKNAVDDQFTDKTQFGSPSGPWLRAFQQLGQEDGASVLPFEQSLQSSLEAAGKGRPAGELQQTLDTQTSAYLSSAKGKYDDAKDKVDEDNQTLSTELARLGPSLTDEQKQKYIDQFHKAHQADYDNEANAAKALGAALNLVGPSALKNFSPDAARAALDAAQELAQTPQGAEGAANFVKLVANNPDSGLYSALRAQLGGDDALKGTLQDIVNKAVPNLYANDLSSAGGDPSAAVTKLQSQLSELSNTQALGDLGPSFNDGVNALAQAAKSGDYSALQNLKDGPFSDAFKTAGVQLAVAAQGGPTSAPTTTPKVSAEAYLSKLAGDGSKGLNVIAQGLKRLTDTLPGAQDAAKLLGKYAAGLSLVSNVLNGSQDLQDLIKNGGAGDVVKLIGDSISTVGSVLALAGVSGPVGIAVAAVGFLVKSIGDIISGHEKEDHWNSEEKDLLQKIGLPDDVAKGLTAADPDSLDLIAKQEKLSPEQVQQLATQHPELFFAPGYAQAFLDAANACGVSGDQLNGFAGALLKDNPDYMSLLFAQRESYDGVHSAEHDQTLRAVLLGDGTEARKFIQQNDPQVLSGDSEQQSKADIDYQNRFMGGDPFMTVGNDFKNNKDPAYQAEIINQMKKDGSLDNFIKTVGERYAYNGWNDATGQAIKNAQAEGVISASDAQRYLAELGVS